MGGLATGLIFVNVRVWDHFRVKVHIQGRYGVIPTLPIAFSLFNLLPLVTLVIADLDD